MGFLLVFAFLIVLIYGLSDDSPRGALKTTGGTTLRNKDGNITVHGLAFMDGLDGEFDAKVTPEDWFDQGPG